ncbi:14634_t:CDS:2 [Entrophospora sp. SA101]|nr:14634_t:CDS:2 [Entrophospora sp. SA101]
MEFLASAPPPIIKPNIYNVDPKNATLVPLNIAIRIFVKRLETNLNKKNVHKADLLTHWIMVIKDEWGNFDLKKIINREWKTGDVPKVLLQRNFRIKKKQNSWKIQASLLEKNKKPKVDKDKIFKQEEKEIENINDNVKQINLEDITIKEVENKKIKSISWADEVNEEFGEVSSITRNNNEDDVNDDYMNNNVTENETTPIKNHLTQIEEIEPYNSANEIFLPNHEYNYIITTYACLRFRIEFCLSDIFQFIIILEFSIEIEKEKMINKKIENKNTTSNTYNDDDDIDDDNETMVSNINTLSVLEYILRLSALEVSEQTNHLEVADEKINLFLKDDESSGGGGSAAASSTTVEPSSPTKPTSQSSSNVIGVDSPLVNQMMNLKING